MVRKCPYCGKLVVVVEYYETWWEKFFKDDPAYICVCPVHGVVDKGYYGGMP